MDDRNEEGASGGESDGADYCRQAWIAYYFAPIAAILFEMRSFEIGHYAGA
jgi:hypothetical protein